ncbi:MAG: HAD-IIIA family hydrolase [Deltaproteobacteria bacterium]|nr:HAD-IIIA family hydrolase [Deltaproteobacteria bacterium]
MKSLRKGKKIKTPTEIVKIADRLKRQGKTIVTFNGSFDVLHIGHVRSFQEAKKRGDVLIVLLNSDKSIRMYKGPNRPIIPEDIRAEIISAIEGVDYVTIFDEINPIAILDRIKPHVHCNGSDWGRNCIERQVVEKNGGRIHILKWHRDFSTTRLINRIVDAHMQGVNRAVFLDRDGTINENGKGYIHRIEEFKFLPGAIEGLQMLSQTEYKIIIVTNQSGIGRGFYSENDFSHLNNWFVGILKDNGIRVDKVYYCPHAPDEGCLCRKPGIGMLLRAAQEFALSLSQSWVIGDDPRDIVMARTANVRSIKIGAKMPRKFKLEPNFYASNLKDAVEIILREARETGLE